MLRCSMVSITLWCWSVWVVQWCWTLSVSVPLWCCLIGVTLWPLTVGVVQWCWTLSVSVMAWYCMVSVTLWRWTVSVVHGVELSALILEFHFGFERLELHSGSELSLLRNDIDSQCQCYAVVFNGWCYALSWSSLRTDHGSSSRAPIQCRSQSNKLNETTFSNNIAACIR